MKKKASEEPVPLPARTYAARNLVWVSAKSRTEKDADKAFQKYLNAQLKEIVSDEEASKTLLDHIAKGVSTFVREELLDIPEQESGPYDSLVKEANKLYNCTTAIGTSELALLNFPPGHPQDGGLYVGHPLEASAYYPFDSFHNLLFQHKFAEAIRLLMALGAKEIQIEHVEGWTEKEAGNITASLPMLFAEGGVSYKRKASNRETTLFTAVLDNPASPHVPDGLLWYPYEPAWNAIANGCISHGMKAFALKVEHRESYGITTALAGAYKGIGIGGEYKFRSFRKTSWSLAGSFVPPQNLWDRVRSIFDGGRESPRRQTGEPQ